MPAVTKPDPKRSYRPWSSFARAVDGSMYVVTPRHVLAGDHPLVRAVPAMFVRYDAPDAEVAEARNAALAEGRERNEARRRERAAADRSRLAKLLEAGAHLTPAARASRDSDRRRAEERRTELESQAARIERDRRESAERAAREREIAALAARTRKAAS